MKFTGGPITVENSLKLGEMNPSAITRSRMPGPQGSRRENGPARLRGRTPRATLKPSSGAIGSRLNTASSRFQNTSDFRRSPRTSAPEVPSAEKPNRDCEHGGRDDIGDRTGERDQRGALSHAHSEEERVERHRLAPTESGYEDQYRAERVEMRQRVQRESAESPGCAVTQRVRDVGVAELVERYADYQRD